MGRVKLKIKKLENTNGRQQTYGKRKNGIMKKASELSILCDIPMFLLMFSPTGKPSLCKGKRSIEEVITKYAQVPLQERTKKKLESLEALKKTFKKLDHDVNIPEFFGTSSQTIEDLTNQSNLLQSQLSEVHKRLSYWTSPDKINSLELLGQLENSVRESLTRIQEHKETFGKQQIASLECNNQFQNEMQIPFRMNATEPQFPPMQWLPNCDTQHIVLPDDPNLLAHRDVECSASSSYGSYPGYFTTGKSNDLSNSGQESSISGILNELNNGNASLRMQLTGQYPYMPYNLNLLNDVKFQPAPEMSLHEVPVDFHVNGSFEPPKPSYCTTPGSWASTSGPCAVTMFEEQLFSQQPN